MRKPARNGRVSALTRASVGGGNACGAITRSSGWAGSQRYPRPAQRQGGVVNSCVRRRRVTGRQDAASTQPDAGVGEQRARCADIVVLARLARHRPAPNDMPGTAMAQRLRAAWPATPQQRRQAVAAASPGRGMWQETQSHWGWPSARRCRCWLWRGWGLPTTAPMFLDAPSAPAGSTTRALRQRSPCADSRVNGRVRPSPRAYATDRTNSPAPSDRRQRAPWPLLAPTSAPSACAGWCGPFRRFIRAMPWLDICAGTAATTRNVQIKKLDRLR